jgi:hypothetical protein
MVVAVPAVLVADKQHRDGRHLARKILVTRYPTVPTAITSC